MPTYSQVGLCIQDAYGYKTPLSCATKDTEMKVTAERSYYERETGVFTIMAAALKILELLDDPLTLPLSKSVSIRFCFGISSMVTQLKGNLPKP